MSDRREFLKFLAGSPLLLAYPALLEAFTQAPTAQAAAATLASAADALDVYDFEAMARRVLPPAHWGYMATGVDGEETLRANPRGFDRYQLRVRRFVDVSRIDMGMELFGQKFTSPVMLCPVGSQRAFHAEGELAVARAAQARGQLQILSTQSSTAIEDVAKARGGSGLWYQLYTTNNWDVTTKLLKRAEAAGCPVVAVTVDLPAGRNTETDQRMARVDTRACASCHGVAGPAADGRAAGIKPMFAGLDMKGVTLTSATLTWDFVKRVKDVTKMKVVIKGLESADDATLAVTSGADGIIVSNHGGRATETGRPTIDALPEVVQGAGGRMPVLLDGGVRRGTDVFKALALGATAVGIGRPYIWGLSSFGQAGVDRVLQILDTELRLAMVGCGTVALKDITAKSLIDTRIDPAHFGPRARHPSRRLRSHCPDRRRRDGRGLSRDRPKLDRDVAIKVLPVVVGRRCRAAGSVRARSRGARVAEPSEHRGDLRASKKATGVRALVMELVEGRRSRIASRAGRFPSTKRCRSRGRSRRRSKRRTSTGSSIAI